MNVQQKIQKLKKFTIAENLTLGLDIGITSCGWAVLDEAHKKIIGAGVWGFEKPENEKRHTNASIRRTARGQRRRLRRRRYRMRDIRKLLFQHKLLSSPFPAKDIKGVSKPSLNPWAIRAKGLDKLLSDEEFATALIHIAKHRGYRSNSKSEKSSNAPPEDKKMLSGLENIKEKSGKYRTVGEMFAKDAEFSNKKRNKEGDYSHTILRSLHEDEVRILFKQQRKFGNDKLSQELEQEYAKLAFDQLPLQGSEKLLGSCPFEPDEKRASAVSYSFEKFRFLSKLNNMRIEDGSKSGRRLTNEEIKKAINGFGKNGAKISFNKLKKLIGLANGAEFKGVGKDGLKNDVARNSKGAAFGSHALYNVLGESMWNSLVKTPKILDDIAHILTFVEEVKEIEKRLNELKLEAIIIDAIMIGVNEGKFAQFSKAGHISTKAARKINEGLIEGKTYSEACELAGYDHSKENPANLDMLNNPVAKRAIIETLKQVNAIVQELKYRFGKIHIELGRDVGKSAIERGKIEKGIKDRTKNKQSNKEQFLAMVAKSDCSDGELARYEMWKEQKHFCIFCAKHIAPHDLLDGANMCEIEHVLPLSRSRDNSWNNKVLACKKCNQDKGNRTPFEWFGGDSKKWNDFEFRVKELKANKNIKGFKIRNLLMKDFAERESQFIERNKNDMRYSARVIASELRSLYSENELRHQNINGKETGKVRIFARSGQITATLRRFWGLDRFKYLPDIEGKKQRIEDERHHAIDAMVVGACSESTLQRLTKAMQQQEINHFSPLKVSNFPPPWEGFIEQVKQAYENAPVARSENRRGRGQGHGAKQIRKIRMEEGRRITYERKAVKDITKKELERIKDPERNKDIYEALFEWIAAGKPEDNPPRRNNGFEIKKVTIRSETNATTERSGFELNGGLVDNGDMVRVDVFEKDKKFFLVPIYVHQVADKKQFPNPPNRAILGRKPEKEWLEVDENYNFKFSLYPYSYVETINSAGEVKEGYYRTTDRSGAKISLSRQLSRQQMIRGIGVKTLHSFKKYHIDRLGNKNEIKSEVRTWRGAVCT